MPDTCRYCHRTIVYVDRAWIDPEATGDDSMWRETCDSHDTFEADHEPLSNVEQWEDDFTRQLYDAADDHEADVLDELRLRAGISWNHTEEEGCVTGGWTNLARDAVCQACGKPRREAAPEGIVKCANCGAPITDNGDDLWIHNGSKSNNCDPENPEGATATPEGEALCANCSAPIIQRADGEWAHTDPRYAVPFTDCLDERGPIGDRTARLAPGGDDA